MERKFNNNLNERIEANGKEYWVSRSVAVVGVVIAITKSNSFVLVTKRSEKMDQPHKLCVPCGYLDWDENCYDAMLREVYEETSLYLPDYQHIIMSDKAPFRIQDDPTKDARQNISFSYCTVLDFRNQSIDIPFDIENFKNEETDEIKWVPIDTIYDGTNSVWAFNHNEVINLALKHIGIK